MKASALITGGSRGIGLGIARALAGEGFNIAVNGVRPESQVLDVLDDLRASAVDVIYCQGDISNRGDRNAILQAVRSQFGCLNVLVNNAGVAPSERMDILDASEESYERVMRINLKGPYFLTQAVAQWMVNQRESDASYGGCIINVGSISATVVSTNRGEYCLSKAGFAMMSLLWATRLGAYNIPVYEIRPGVIKTDMTSGVRDKYDRLIEEGLTVQPRWGLAEDAGRAAAALARGDFAYSTGQVVMIDGGLTISRL